MQRKRFFVLIVLLLIILVFIISVYYFYNRSSADIVADQNNIKPTYKPSPAILVKQGVYKSIEEAEVALVDPTKGLLNKIDSRSSKNSNNTIIVKLKKGQDLTKITKLSNITQQYDYNRIEIESSKPLIEKAILQKNLQNFLTQSPSKSGEITKKYNNLNLENIYLVKVKNTSDFSSQIKKLNQNPAVEYAEADSLVRPQSIPNDPFYQSFGSWGQNYDDLWGLKKINPESAWDTTKGDGIIVAIIDSGIDYNHPDLKRNIWINEDEIPNNQIDDDNNGYIDDDKGWDFIGTDYENSTEDNDPIDKLGHGTHVAGTVAAVSNNNIGILGVAPRAKIMAVKGIADNGSGWLHLLAQGIFYAANNGAKVINASFGSNSGYRSYLDCITYAHDIMGVTFVASAGNDNNDLGHYPSDNLYAISVSSLDHNDLKSDFSNYGDNIDIAAPGGDSYDWRENYKFVNILSTRAQGTDMYENSGKMVVGNKYYRSAGTSMSSPHVSGSGALIYAIKPDFTPNTVERILKASAFDLGIIGWDRYYGNGRVDASQAINLAKSVKKDASPPESPLNFRAIKVHPYYVDLAWDESEDNNLIVDYILYRDGQEISNIYIHSFNDYMNIEPGTDYEYSIRAFDGISYSSVKIINVSTPIDTTPPTTPTNLTGQPFAKSVHLSWTASTDNFDIPFYILYRNNLEYAVIRDETNNITFTDNQVNANTSYEYYVIARDNSDNLSSDSNHLNLTTTSLTFIDSGSTLDQLAYTNNIAWGDYDNDGDLDFVNSGSTESPYSGDETSKIYRNDGNNQFINIFTIEDDGDELFDAVYDWGDYDNDRDLDLAVSGKIFNFQTERDVFVAKIYKNIGNDQFQELMNLASIAGYILWSDFDNDGDLDIALGGYDNASFKFKLLLYENRSNKFIIRTQIQPTSSIWGLSAGDYNNDGSQDLVATGLDHSVIYQNNGHFNFAETKQTLEGLEQGDASWSDYDNDGDIDLTISGLGLSDDGDVDEPHTIIYQNNNGQLTQVLDFNIWSRSLAWSDYDNDGDLDLLVTGFLYQRIGWYDWQPLTKIFQNAGNNTFFDIGSEIINVGDGSASWADYDLDNDVDIIICGTNRDTGWQQLCRIYNNLTADASVSNNPNIAPKAPTKIYPYKALNGQISSINWSQGSDQETPSKALYYNIRLGTLTDPDKIISGYYGTPLFGNYLQPKISSTQLGIKLQRTLPSGNYYFGVQSIDSGLKASSWSQKQITIK